MLCSFVVQGNDTPFRVSELSISEEINLVTRIQLLVRCNTRNLELSEVLLKNAELEFFLDGQTRVFNGVVWDIRYAGNTGHKVHGYYIDMRPAHWKLSYNIASRMFHELSRVDVTKEVFKKSDFRENEHIVYSLQAPGDYAAYPQLIQYEETDLHFMQRLIEFDGLAAYIGSGDNEGKLVITDVQFPDCEVSQLRMIGPSGMSTGEFVVDGFRIKASYTPEKVKLCRESPEVAYDAINEEHDVADGHSGTIETYNHYHLDAAEGARLAKVRAEEISCRRVVGAGGSNCFFVRPGHLLTIMYSDAASSNSPGGSGGSEPRQLITRVLHKAVSTIEETKEANSKIYAQMAYSNKFSSLVIGAGQVIFRPQRKTPVPRVPGLMHATIDNPEEQKLPKFDRLTRQRMAFPFDVEENSAGQGSKDVDMARTYGAQISPDGPSGFHFPLPPQTDIVWAGLDGDPDQPVILGALPRPGFTAPAANYPGVANQIATRSGQTLTMHDERTGGWDSVESLAVGEEVEESDKENPRGFVRLFSPSDRSEMMVGHLHRPAPSAYRKEEGFPADDLEKVGRGHRLFSGVPGGSGLDSFVETIIGEMSVASAGREGAREEEGFSLFCQKGEELLVKAIQGIISNDGGKFLGSHLEALKDGGGTWSASQLMGTTKDATQGITISTSQSTSSLEMGKFDPFNGVRLKTEGQAIYQGPTGVYVSAYPKLSDALGEGGTQSNDQGTEDLKLAIAIEIGNTIMKTLGCSSKKKRSKLAKDCFMEIMNMLNGGQEGTESHLVVSAPKAVSFYTEDRLSVQGGTAVELASSKGPFTASGSAVMIIGTDKGVSGISDKKEVEAASMKGSVTLYSQKKVAEVSGKTVTLAAGKVVNVSRVELKMMGIDIAHDMAPAIKLSKMKLDIGPMTQTISIKGDEAVFEGLTASVKGLQQIDVKASKEVKIG